MESLTIQEEGRFSISVRSESPEDMDLAKGRMEAEVRTKGIEISHFWPYFAGHSHEGDFRDP